MQAEMAVQNVHNKEIRLVLSSDAKPRLKWTQELHQCFVDSVNQLGGPEKATPKSLMRIMGIHGLTLYQLKSHLQKYRLGKIQQSQENQEQKLEETQKVYPTRNIRDEELDKTNEGLQVSQALKIQMEVQRKLHEQIQVQRHLQLRIEAQGKYLQSVLKKAQETLSGNSSCFIEVEQAKVQLSQFMSMVDSGCPSSSFSILTESDGPMLRDVGNELQRQNGYSLDCFLTSSESSGRKADYETKHQIHKNYNHGNDTTSKGKRKPVVLSLMDMHSNDRVYRMEKSGTKNSGEQVRRLKTLENVDLNSEFQNDFDLDPKVIDLNCSGLELFSKSFSVKKQHK